MAFCLELKLQFLSLEIQNGGPMHERPLTEYSAIKKKAALQATS